MSSPTFPRKLTQSEQDALWQRVNQQFALNPADWHPLVLNGLPLGYLNEKWLDLLLKDWPEHQRQPYQSGLALNADDWLSLGDQLQHTARIWCDLGLFDGWRNDDKKGWRRIWRRLIDLEPGEFAVIEFVIPRSGAFHRRHMAIINAVFDAHWYHLFLEIDTCALGPTVISIPLRS